MWPEISQDFFSPSFFLLLTRMKSPAWRLWQVRTCYPVVCQENFWKVQIFDWRKEIDKGLHQRREKVWKIFCSRKTEKNVMSSCSSKDIFALLRYFFSREHITLKYSQFSWLHVIIFWGSLERKLGLDQNSASGAILVANFLKMLFYSRMKHVKGISFLPSKHGFFKNLPLAMTKISVICLWGHSGPSIFLDMGHTHPNCLTNCLEKK